MSQMICSTCGLQLRGEVKFCPSCGAAVAETASAKAAGNPMSSTTRISYGLLAIGLVGFFMYLFIEYLPGKPNPVIEKQSEVAMATMYTDVNLEQQPIESKVENDKIIISLNQVLEKKIVSFEYQAQSTTIPLLAYISAQGKLVTCIRLCEPCNSSKFRILGDKLACGNCETEWKLNNLEGVQGSCQKYPPFPIPSTIVGSQIEIDLQAVKNWKMRI